MRTFKYRKKWKGLLIEMVFYLTQIHEFKGKQTLFIEAQADTLTQLVEIAKIQSTEALLRTKVKFYQLRSEIKKSPTPTISCTATFLCSESVPGKRW